MTGGDPPSYTLLVEYVTLVALQLQHNVLRRIVFEAYGAVACGRLIETVKPDALHAIYEI